MPFFSGSSHCELGALETAIPKYWRDTGIAHKHSGMQIHMCARMHQQTHTFHILLAWRANKRSCFVFFVFFISGTPSCLGHNKQVSLWAAEPEVWCRSTEAEQWHEKLPCHLKPGHTERHLPPDAGAGVPAACRDSSQGPPRPVHIHIISNTQGTRYITLRQVSSCMHSVKQI